MLRSIVYLIKHWLAELNIPYTNTQRFNPDQVNPCRDYFYVLADTGFPDWQSLPLRKEELSRAERFLNDADRAAYWLAHGLLNNYLSHYCQTAVQDLPLLREPHGKPFLRQYPFHFSISRSGSFVLLAFGPERIGADLERIRPCDDYLPVVGQHFHPAEKAVLTTPPEPETFFQVWTRKEALLKTVGTGLTDHLDQINTLPDEIAYEGEIYHLQSIRQRELMLSLSARKLSNIAGFSA